MFVSIGFREANREFKGKSLFKLVNDYVVVDLETTGLDAVYDSIIEIGAIRYKDNKEVDRYHCLINVGFPLDDFVKKHTGITDEMLRSGIDIKDAINEVDKFIKDDIVVAHNAHFDINFLYQAFIEVLNKPFKNNFIDTMRLSRNLNKQFENHKLSTLVKLFGYNVDIKHRSISDCVAVNLCYQYMKYYITSNSININAQNRLKKVKPGDLKSENIEFDEEHPLYKMNCVFTGKLEKMQRKDAWQLVLNVGGIISDTVNKSTNFLILGNFDYNSNIKGNKSSKQKKAEKLVIDGYDITVISENTFYDLINSNN